MFQRVDVPVCRCSSVSRVDVPLCRCSSVSMFHRSKCDCSSVIVPAHYCRCYRRVVLSFVFVSTQLKIVFSTHENECVWSCVNTDIARPSLPRSSLPRSESGLKNVYIMISLHYITISSIKCVTHYASCISHLKNYLHMYSFTITSLKLFTVTEKNYCGTLTSLEQAITFTLNHL